MLRKGGKRASVIGGFNRVKGNRVLEGEGRANHGRGYANVRKKN